MVVGLYFNGAEEEKCEYAPPSYPIAIFINKLLERSFGSSGELNKFY